jgi:hypothetical protein
MIMDQMKMEKERHRASRSILPSHPYSLHTKITKYYMCE